MPEQFPERITQDTKIIFSVERFGLYAIWVAARCQSAKQSEFGVNETLRLEIDDLKFREIPPLDKPQYNKIPPAWNGADQQGLTKTVVFIIALNKGEHSLHFFPTNEVLIEKWSCHLIENSQEIIFDLGKQAEDGDKRPWYTFAFIKTPLVSIDAKISVNWHFLDGDDVKLIIDGKVQENTSSKFWRYWLWSARPWQVLSGPKNEQKKLNSGLPQDVHYVEFWIDKTPTLHRIVFNLGDFQPKRIPTVNDPKWTGNFVDDTDQMILARALFGEVRNTLIPDVARHAIGWVIKNRVISKNWPNTYWEVITKPSQFSAFNVSDDNRQFVENPLYTGKKIDKLAWKHAYEIAGKLIKNEIPDPTNGANHYYDDSINTPDWAKDNKPTLTVTYSNQYDREANIFFFDL
ncbi:MAG TPA: hypothetical protein DEP87_00285 [Candidatus Pacebacteria bacterium]|nr:hypothetical protein [Candidatus Paceibacterota bacterium]